MKEERDPRLKPGGSLPPPIETPRRFVVDLDAGEVWPYVEPPAVAEGGDSPRRDCPPEPVNPPPRPELVALFAEAIAHFEGFYDVEKNYPARRNSNPGNLRRWGPRPVRDGLAVFPNVAEGFRALRHQIRKNLDERKLSIREFFAGNGDYPGYAPAADSNDPDAYAEFVRGFLAERGVEVGIDRRGLL